MGTCIMCGSKGMTRAHYVPGLVRSALPTQQRSFSLMAAASNVEPMPTIDLEERAHGRGVFDTQPRVLCGTCNSAWMTPHEDLAGPLLADMIRSSGPRVVEHHEALAVGIWAVAALMIRSTVDPAIQRLSPDTMRAFRLRGIGAIDASVAVFSIANTGAFFDGDAVGSTYVSDAEAPREHALALFFFQKIVVVAGVGTFSASVQRATRAFGSGTVLTGPPYSAGQQGWPTRGDVVDRDLLPALGIEQHSRSMFVPATPVRDSNVSRRTVVRVPEAFMRSELTSDQQLLTSMHAFEEIVARRIATHLRPRNDGTAQRM